LLLDFIFWSFEQPNNNDRKKNQMKIPSRYRLIADSKNRTALSSLFLIWVMRSWSDPYFGIFSFIRAKIPIIYQRTTPTASFRMYQKSREKCEWFVNARFEKISYLG
jgi:hypothetical protein